MQVSAYGKGFPLSKLLNRKTLLCMKLTIVLVVMACVQVMGKGTAQTVTLSLKDAPVQNVLKEVSRQTGISIVYKESLFKDFSPVTIAVKDATVQQVMKLCFTGQPFTYQLKGNIIEIEKENP